MATEIIINQKNIRKRKDRQLPKINKRKLVPESNKCGNSSSSRKRSNKIQSLKVKQEKERIAMLLSKKLKQENLICKKIE